MGQGLRGIHRCFCSEYDVFGWIATPKVNELGEYFAEFETAGAIKSPSVLAPYIASSGRFVAGDVPPLDTSFAVDFQLVDPINPLEKVAEVGGAKVIYDTDGHNYLIYSLCRTSIEADPYEYVDAEHSGAYAFQVIDLNAPPSIAQDYWFPDALRDYEEYLRSKGGLAATTITGGYLWDSRTRGFSRDSVVMVNDARAKDVLGYCARFRFSTGEWRFGVAESVGVTAPFDDTPIADFEVNEINHGLTGIEFNDGDVVRGWSPDNGDQHEGTWGCKSHGDDTVGPIDLSITVNVKNNGSNLTFWWRHDNRGTIDNNIPSTDDYFAFYVDGIEKLMVTHALDPFEPETYETWQQFSLAGDLLAAGIHTFMWRHYRATTNLGDAHLVSWIDYVEFPELEIGAGSDGGAYIALPAQMADGGDPWVLSRIYDEGEWYTGIWANDLGHAALVVPPTMPAILTPTEFENALHTKSGFPGSPLLTHLAYTRRGGFDYVLVADNYESPPVFYYYDGRRDGWFELDGIGAGNIYAFENGDVAVASPTGVRYIEADGTVRWTWGDMTHATIADARDKAPALSGNCKWLQAKNMDMVVGARPDWPAIDASAVYAASTPPIPNRAWYRDSQWAEPAVSLSRRVVQAGGQPTVVIHRTVDTREKDANPFDWNASPFTINYYAAAELLNHQWGHTTLPARGYRAFNAANVGGNNFDAVPGCCGCGCGPTDSHSW